MNMQKSRLKELSLLLAATVSIAGSLFLPASPAIAQAILQEQGTLQPTQNKYSFTGQAGQTVTISINSPDFDTVLVLLDSNGEEIARNDDYARSLNSTIVMTLPNSGTYQVLAQSFSGQGGNYTLSVTPATPYEQAYAQAVALYQQGQYEQAIAAYTEAIEVDPNQPLAYAERADARYSQAGSISPDAINDYNRAAELFEQAGDTENARMLREQITYLQSPPLAGETEETPSP
jgi:tetratricopeptide (TPR) repeat protein